MVCAVGIKTLLCYCFQGCFHISEFGLPQNEYFFASIDELPCNMFDYCYYIILVIFLFYFLFTFCFYFVMML